MRLRQKKKNGFVTILRKYVLSIRNYFGGISQSSSLRSTGRQIGFETSFLSFVTPFDDSMNPHRKPYIPWRRTVRARKPRCTARTKSAVVPIASPTDSVVLPSDIWNNGKCVSGVRWEEGLEVFPRFFCDFRCTINVGVIICTSSAF